MKRNSNYFLPVIILIFLLQAFTKPVFAQAKADKKTKTHTIEETPEIKKLKVAVEADPNNLEAHRAFMKALHYDFPELIKQYDLWIKKYPSSAIFPYVIGNALSNSENPKARPYLLKAIQLKPDYAAAYSSLAGDAERWGEFDSSYRYLQKAAELEPTNPDYVFSFAYANKLVNPKKYRDMSLQVAKDFPNTERGSQSLYWLANNAEDDQEKIRIYEQQKKDFPVDKFRWTKSGMQDYFGVLLKIDPRKALALAEEIPVKKDGDDEDSYDAKIWADNKVMAGNIIRINSLLDAGNMSEALALSDQLTVPRWGAAKEFIILYKSKVLKAAGNIQEAYANVLKAYAKEPMEALSGPMMEYGSSLGKSQAGVDADVWQVRDTAARQAPNFNLENYFTKKQNSLSDYKGKVILLTYWFPGCGPCRGEFPHFENVVKKFKNRNDFVYLGINIVPEQDAYVVPFLRSSHYSFIPLKDNKNWTKGPLDNRGGAPMNFLIGRDGEIIFSNFRTNQSNEQTLETMISAMLNR